MARRRWLPCAALPLLLVAPMVLTAWSAPASASINWASWVDQAVDAVQSQQLIGSSVTVGQLSDVNRSTLTLPDGTNVQVDQRTAVFSDGANQLLVGMTVLGDQQEVVDMINPATGADTTLVLAPGNSQVSQSITVTRGRHHHAPASSPTGVSPSVAGGCYASPDAPFVIGSVYGPLIKGIGVVSCPYGNESLAVIASLAERTSSGSVGVGNTGSASVWGTYLAVDAYDGCSSSSGHQFHTAQLWSVNGALQPGATSGWATLGCR